MAYVALKKCRLNGHDFLIGESIPAEFAQPGAARLIKMGYIAESKEEAEDTIEKEVVRDRVTLTVPVEEGDLVLDVTTEGLQQIFTVLTGKAADAEEVIENMTDSDALILLHVSDSRKSIKAVVEARAKALNGGEE